MLNNKNSGNEVTSKLKEMLLGDIEIVDITKVVKVNEKYLTIAKDVASIYSGIKWDEIEAKSGKKEFPILLKQLYVAFEESVTTGKGIDRKKLNTGIFTALQRELHFKNMSLMTSSGRNAKQKGKDGKLIDVLVLTLTPLELKEYSELNEIGDIIIKSGYLVADNGEFLLEKDVPKILKNGDKYLLKLLIYDGKTYSEEKKKKIIVEKGSETEKRLLKEEKDLLKGMDSVPVEEVTLDDE